MNRRVTVILALLVIGLPHLAWSHSLEEVQAELFKREKFIEITDRPAIDFALKDAEGTANSLSDFRGKVVVLYFVYAGCADVCPLHSELIGRIQEQVNATPMRELVQFVAITTDPARDTADVLTAYGTMHGLDPTNWVFLTSGPDRPDETRALAGRYGLQFTLTPDGAQMHGVVTHVIDRDGRLRARFHGLEFDPTNFVIQVNALTNDHTHVKSRWAEAIAPFGGWAPAVVLVTAMAGACGVTAIAYVRLRRRRTGKPSTFAAWPLQECCDENKVES